MGRAWRGCKTAPLLCPPIPTQHTSVVSAGAVNLLISLLHSQHCTGMGYMAYWNGLAQKFFINVLP